MLPYNVLPLVFDNLLNRLDSLCLNVTHVRHLNVRIDLLIEWDFDDLQQQLLFWVKFLRIVVPEIVMPPKFFTPEVRLCGGSEH